MSDETHGNGEPTDDRQEHAMTDDTDDDGFEQAEVENAEPGQDARTDETAGEEEPPADDDVERGLDGGIRRKLNYALLFGLGLLAFIAVIQFYLNMSSVINQWVTREFRSLFQAVFNLVVLLVVGAAISWQVKRLAA
jgi:hypothetical protein